VKLPKSFVAIDLSQDSRESSERRSTASSKNKENAEESERGRSEERKNEVELPIRDELGNVATPHSIFGQEERKDGVPPAGLPPPALDA
jgi:inositol hexakisphosphate/diphosphoinositol-pentakisphosphate kinase